MAKGDAYLPPELKPTPWWKRLVKLVVLAAMGYGGYYAWKTGALLKALAWLMGQNIIVLTTIAVAALVVLAVGLGGN